MYHQVFVSDWMLTVTCLEKDRWTMFVLILILTVALDSIVLYWLRVDVSVGRCVVAGCRMQVVELLDQSRVDTNGDSRRDVVGTTLIAQDGNFVTRNYRQNLALADSTDWTALIYLMTIWSDLPVRYPDSQVSMVLDDLFSLALTSYAPMLPSNGSILTTDV